MVHTPGVVEDGMSHPPNMISLSGFAHAPVVPVGLVIRPMIQVWFRPALSASRIVFDDPSRISTICRLRSFARMPMNDGSEAGTPFTAKGFGRVSWLIAG